MQSHKAKPVFSLLIRDWVLMNLSAFAGSSSAAIATRIPIRSAASRAANRSQVGLFASASSVCCCTCRPAVKFAATKTVERKHHLLLPPNFIIS